MDAATVSARPTHRLGCMEIWGGNRAAEDSVSVFGIDAWVLSRPHGGNAHGGDIHYVSMCGSGRTARFVVADVAGHGDEAAGLAARLRDLMRKNINRVDQSRFARALNREFAHLAKDGAFATAALATYFAPTDHFIVCNAGHPPPVWYRASKASWQYLLPDSASCVQRFSNLPLGVIEPTEFRQFAVPLTVGDCVLIYTDSLIEARNRSGQCLEADGLLTLLPQIPLDRPELFNRMLLDRLTAWMGSDVLEDDFTLLLLCHSAGNPPFPSVRTLVKVVGKLVGLVDV